MTGSPGTTTARLAVAAITTAGMALSGCGSGDRTTDGPDSPSATSAAGSAAPATGETVRIDDMAFAPATVTIAAGDTVTWEFSDTTAHAVQGIGDTAMAIDSPIRTDGTWRHTFATPGTYRYLCPLHPEMRGTITVR